MKKYIFSDICPFFNDEDFQIEWRDYLQVRKLKRAPNTDSALGKQLERMMKFSEGRKELALKVVENSNGTVHAYVGLFDLPPFAKCGNNAPQKSSTKNPSQVKLTEQPWFEKAK